MSERADFYALLGVDPEASADEIHRAYRDRVKGCHPDRLAGLDADLRRLAEEKMMQLNEAHRVLRSEELRARYDATQAGARSATPASGRDSRSPGGTAAGDAHVRDRMGEQGLVVRAAAMELRDKVMSAGRGWQWTDAEATGLTFALEGRAGRRRELVLVDAVSRLDEASLVRTLRRIHARTRGMSSKWWRRETVHAFVGAVHFADRDRLAGVVERFNETQSQADRPLRAALVDLVNWTTAPGSSVLEDHLPFLHP